MSFRKRGEVIGTNGISGRAPARDVLAARRIPAAVPARGPLLNASAVPVGVAQQRVREQNESEAAMKNPGVRPSLITSQPTISTGCSDLDKVLLHQGLPLGHSLFVEESGTTDFASVILRAFASQGIMHNKVVKDQLNCHVIVIGVSSQWSKELPGLYKGSTKEQKKAKILENESKLSVSNLSNTSSTSRNDKDMKIAWRYGLSRQSEQKQLQNDATYEFYSNQFDITQRIVPSPSPQDITYLPILNDYSQIIQNINSVINTQLKQNSTKIIRLIIPNLLNPSIYNPMNSNGSFIFPFVHSLRALLRKFSNNLVLISSTSVDLYPRDTLLASTLENLMDSVIHLQPFNQDMSLLLEKAYKNEPSKIQHGLVNIVKLPVLSDRGLMMVQNGVYAFKNGRKRFEIDEWSIPVEDDSQEGTDGGQTKKNIDF